MLRALFGWLFESPHDRAWEDHDIEHAAMRDLKQIAGTVVTARALCVWVGSAGRYLTFDPPLDVRIRTHPDRLVFDSLANERGETLVLYEVTAHSPERLPAGASKCYIDGPAYGPAGVTHPAWWEQLSPAFFDTSNSEDTSAGY